MSLNLINFSSSLIQKQAIREIVECNDFTINFGLVLTPGQVVELVETRTYSLQENSRIEFRGGVIDKIIKEFCNSPFLSMDNYAETLHEIIEMFYYYKNETLDLMGDDDLIKFMKEKFDGVCQGSLELLSGRELAKMARNLRYGYPPDYLEDDGLGQSEEDDYEEY